MKTVNKKSLKNMIENGLVEGRCFDYRTNDGFPQWKAVLIVLSKNFLPQHYLIIEDKRFDEKSLKAYWVNDEIIKLPIDTNLHYEFRLTKKGV